MANKTYSSRKLSVVWAGFNFTGSLADDNSVVFGRRGDRISTSTGQGGGYSVSKLPDRSGTITLTLQQGSDGDTLLSAVCAAEDLSEQLVASPAVIIANDGSALAYAKGVRIMTSPEVTYGIDAGANSRVWVLDVEELQRISAPIDATDATIPAQVATAIATAKGFFGD